MAIENVATPFTFTCGAGGSQTILKAIAPSSRIRGEIQGVHCTRGAGPLTVTSDWPSRSPQR